MLGVALLMVSQNASWIAQSFATSKVVLSEKSLAADTFAKFPVPIHQNFYFFHLTNGEEVLQGAIPEVEERGPYVFR